MKWTQDERRERYMCTERTTSEARVVSVHNIRFPSNRELGLPAVSERYGVVHAAEDILDAWPCVAILQPA